MGAVSSTLLVQPMKLTTARCKTMWAKIKSANALSGLKVSKWLRFWGLIWKAMWRTEWESISRNANDFYYLQSEADGEDEAPDAGDEPRQEGVEGEGTDQAAVGRLHDSGKEDVGQVDVDDLTPLGSGGAVARDELGHKRAQGGGRLRVAIVVVGPAHLQEGGGG